MTTAPHDGAGRLRSVLHVSQSTETGVPHVIEDYVRSQRAAGWDVVVACPGGTLASLMATNGVPVIHWPAAREPDPRLLLRELRALAAVVDQVRPDLVHLHSAKAGLAGRLHLRGALPTVYTPHAWSWHAATGVTRRAALTWERHAARWSVTCCVSESERRDATTVGLRGRVELIPNDVDVDALRASTTATRAEARRALGVDDDARLAVCCARLAPQKGQDTLIRAWADVHSRVDHAELVLVGGGEDEARLRSLAGTDPTVRFAGARPREETLLWMTASDVVVCPSRYEGMSLVPLEAGALGRAVVAADFEGIREGGWGEARVIVPVGDAAALSDALARVLDDDPGRTRAEAAALARADQLAARPRGVSRLLALYDELVPHE